VGDRVEPANDIVAIRDLRHGATSLVSASRFGSTILEGV
jgi:hypothetical protein